MVRISAPRGPIGSETVATVPSPSRLRMATVPPWASTMRRVMGSPSPVPPSRVVKNASNARGRTSPAMPSPVSRTSMASPSGVAPDSDHDRAPGRRRLERVQHEVQHRVLQLEAVRHDGLGPAFDDQRERHALAGALGADEGREVREQRAHRHGLQAEARRPGEAQELRDEVVEAAQLAGDLRHDLEDVAAAVGDDLRQLLLEDAEVDLQGVQRVSHLVRDAGGDRLGEGRVRLCPQAGAGNCLRHPADASSFARWPTERAIRCRRSREDRSGAGATRGLSLLATPRPPA